MSFFFSLWLFDSMSVQPWASPVVKVRLVKVRLTASKELPPRKQRHTCTLPSYHTLACTLVLNTVRIRIHSGQIQANKCEILFTGTSLSVHYTNKLLDYMESNLSLAKVTFKYINIPSRNTCTQLNSQYSLWITKALTISCSLHGIPGELRIQK